MYPGEGFGELALLYSAPRSASIKALKSSFFWFIDRKTFKEFIKTII
jgi:CRP-like cAMP-binding protein